MSLSNRVSGTLVAQCLEKYWTYFLQIFSIGAFWDKDERFKFWEQKVKVQGHTGVQHAGYAPFGLDNAIS